MKQARADCKINGLRVMEVEIQNMPAMPAPEMRATYALLSISAKAAPQTHGKCSAYPSNWSKRTNELLAELLESMEEDLLPRHFDLEAASEESYEGIESDGHEETPQI